ncbi:MAG: putative bifunctional diguanylate cyclase/phosphodiesterase [Symbiobacteriia bacterium]
MLALVVIYVVVFFAAHNRLDEDLLVFSSLPVVMAGLFFGLRTGLVAALLSLLLNWALLTKVGVNALDRMTHLNLLDVLVVVIGGVTAGVLSDVLARSRKQARDLRESEGRMRLLFERVPAIVWTTDGQLRFTSSLGAGLNGLHLRSGDLRGMYIGDYFRSDDPDFLPLAAHRRALTGAAVSFEGEWENHTFQAHVEPFLDEEGDLIGTIAIALDVTERKHAAQSLRLSEQRFRSVFDNAATGMALVGLDGRVVQANRSLYRLLGYADDELNGIECIALTHPEHREASERLRTEMLRGQTPAGQMEKRYLHKLGHAVWVQMRASMIHDAEAQPLYFIHEIQDITDRKRAEAQLIHLANHDPLTGLINRRRFHEDLEHHLALARRGDTVGALIFLDLDDFKDVNDSLGHRAGDQLLRALARGMRQGLRESDILARVGGDEFAVLLPQTDAAEAETVAVRILDAVAGQAVVAGGQPIHIGASIGITLFPAHGETAEELFACADLAMYQAKADGGNRWIFYRADREWETEITTRRTWEHRIREALEKDSFVLCCQPILDLHSGQVSRYELLLRMQDDQSGLISPSEFLEVAERFGLIRDIDRWVVRRAIRLAAEVQAVDPDVCLEVNLSGKSLTDEHLLPLIRLELAATGADPHGLVLEITETAAIADLDQARAFIGALKDLGFGFALDDFGVGFASFYSLKQLPIDYLKIDGSFIRQLPFDTVDQHMVRAIVEMAQALGKQTIAEFVTDAATQNLLHGFGVDYAQGFSIGEPMLLDDIWPEITASLAG